MVTTVIVCIDELSCAILLDVSKFVELSSCVTILNTYSPKISIVLPSPDNRRTYKSHRSLLPGLVLLQPTRLIQKCIGNILECRLCPLVRRPRPSTASSFTECFVSREELVAELDGGGDAAKAGVDHLGDAVEVDRYALKRDAGGEFVEGGEGAVGVVVDLFELRIVH